MKKYKIASLLMFIHGAFMEIGGCLALIPVFVIGSDKFILINCVITMALMMFMLPAGIMDGILAITALILILTQYFENKKIID